MCLYIERLHAYRLTYEDCVSEIQTVEIFVINCYRIN